MPNEHDEILQSLATDAPATPTEPTPEAPTPAAPEQDPTAGMADAIAQAVGVEVTPAEPETPKAEGGETPPAEAPKVEQTAEELAQAEEARLDAEAKAMGLKPDTTTRFKELSREAAKVKELEPRVQELQTRLEQQEQVFGFMEQHGVTGEQFGQAVMVLSAMNSGDPMKLRVAYDTLSQQMAAIGQQLGIEAPGFDPLSAHPDLLEEVRNADISRERALEIAQGRQLRTVSTQRSAEQDRMTAEQREIADAHRDLTALEANLRASDPQFEQKWAILRPTLLPALTQLPLRARASAFQQAYAALQLPAAPAVPATTRPDPANPGRPAGAAGAKAPTSEADAIMRTLGIG